MLRYLFAAFFLMGPVCDVVVAQTATPAVAAFEVASVKASADCSNTSIHDSGTGPFQLTNVTMNFLISYAYNARQYQLENAPGWINSRCYTVSAKAEGETRLNYDQLRARLQTLLGERFKLAVHREMKEVQGYALVVAKDGPKLQVSAATTPGPGSIFSTGLKAKGWPMESFTALLANPVGRPVIDKTGLPGKYDIKLRFSPMGTPEATSDSELPSIFTALQEQMGLKLEPKKVPVEMLVIDHLEQVPEED